MSRELGDAAPQDEVEACLTRETSWTERRRALRTLLEASATSGHRVVIGDPDTLYQGDLPPHERWNDVTFKRERDDLFWDLADLASEHSLIMFVRVQLQPQVTEQLSSLHLPQQDLTPDSDWHSPAAILAPELRPLGRWLVSRGALNGRELARQVYEAEETVGTEQAAQSIVAMAHDCLPPSARQAAERLSSVRYEQPLNGTVGPFPLASSDGRGDGPMPAIEPDTFELLLESGFVRKEDSGVVRMPGLVRRFLQRVTAGRADIRKIHRALGRGETVNVTEQLEAHHHAVLALDVDRAHQTSEYYAADLREIAFRLSVEHNEYARAAQIYRDLTELYPKDAYAWEYYAYNLARADSDEITTIRHAFEKAANLEKLNPLYQGRLVGHRAQCGEDITGSFARGLTRFEEMGGDAVSYFALPVLKGLERGGHLTRLRQVVSDSRTPLRKTRHGEIDRFVGQFGR